MKTKVDVTENALEFEFLGLKGMKVVIVTTFDTDEVYNIVAIGIDKTSQYNYLFPLTLDFNSFLEAYDKALEVITENTLLCGYYYDEYGIEPNYKKVDNDLKIATKFRGKI